MYMNNINNINLKYALTSHINTTPLIGAVSI